MATWQQITDFNKEVKRLKEIISNLKDQNKKLKEQNESLTRSLKSPNTRS